MKSFLLAVLLSLLLLSITFNEVSGKELKCYRRYVGEESDKEETCSGDDVVCVTGVDQNQNNHVEFKACGERDFLKNACEETSKKVEGVKCKDPCETDLCNDE